jgi:glycosyltransferase involved in cell wall biosynthesis
MRIGIDAKWFFSGPVSTRVLLKNLLPELIDLYPGDEWVIFLDKRDKHKTLPFQSLNIHLEYVWADVNMLSNTFLLSRKMRHLKLDVMVYQTFPSFVHKIPSISFIHDVLFREFPQFFTWKEKMYFLSLTWLTRNRSERLIATTNYVANELLRFQYVKSRSRIDIVPLAVSKAYQPAEYQNPADLSAVKLKYQLPDQFILFVGRLNIRKNIENLLRALLLIHDRNIKLVIVGESDSKAPDLQKILSSQKLKKRIEFTGAMTDKDLVMTYSLAKLFCFPSFAEGFGLPPLEAMASGVPVIVSEITALPEVCRDAAIYTDPYNPESIANAINDLLENKELYARQRHSGIQRAKEFTWAKSAKSFMESIVNAVNIK